MSEITIYKNKQGHTYELFKSLPSTFVKVAKIFDKEVKDEFWFDRDSERIIKRTRISPEVNKEYPYQQMRATELMIAFKDGTKRKVKQIKVIEYLKTH